MPSLGNARIGASLGYSSSPVVDAGAATAHAHSGDRAGDTEKCDRGTRGAGDVATADGVSSSENKSIPSTAWRNSSHVGLRSGFMRKHR